MSTQQKPLASFTTRAGATVQVTTTGHAGYPYRWICSASEDHRSLGQKSLVLTSRAAKTHADSCQAGGAL